MPHIFAGKSYCVLFEKLGNSGKEFPQGNYLI